MSSWLLIAVLSLGAADESKDDDAMRDLTEELSTELPVDGEDLPLPPAQLPEGSGNDCFSARSVSHFEVLDRENVVVFAPTKRHPYWLKVAGFCRELRFSEAVGFQSRDDRICSYGGDALIAGEDRCSILSIHRLDEASYALLKQQIAAERAAKRARK